MNAPRSIVSSQNVLIKEAISLRDERKRKRKELILIDGERSIVRAIQAHVDLQVVMMQASTTLPQSVDEKLIHDYLQHASVDWVHLSNELLEKVSYGQSAHPVAIAKTPKFEAEELHRICGKQSAALMVLDQVEKPGNVGAAIRTCDALGIDALVLCDPICDLWNPNAIRASAGAIFSFPTFTCSHVELDALFNRSQVNVYTARLEQAFDYHAVQFATKTAIVFGNEANGLGSRWNKHSSVCIPMRGVGDSLNVSVSAAMMLAELQRQRRLQ